MFSVIIPTMWMCASFTQTLDTLESIDLVKEIIIIDNNKSQAQPLDKYTKVVYLPQEENIFISASWNMGVARAQEQFICILNDDVIPNESMFAFMAEQLANTSIGIVGGNNACWTNKRHTNELMTISQLPLGFGTCMFMQRQKYTPIPEQIKLWYNDDYLFNTVSGHHYTYIGAKVEGGLSQTLENPQFKSQADVIKAQDKIEFEKVMKKPLKICVYAISKNEEKFVERFYNSCKDADLILLCDTGSTDNTAKLAKKVGIKVYDITVTPWRFDTARNTALNLIPKNYDVCISLDLDEELQPGWREEIERLWVKGKTNRMRYKYDWGNNLVFYYEKIHARSGFWWYCGCHETLYADKRTAESWAHTDELLVVHKPDPTKSRGQYMDLLEMDIAENPHNVRHQFYYARELFFNRRYAEGADACEKYLGMPGANWNHERAYARRVQGKCYDALGQGDKALIAHRQGTMEAPLAREPWMDLAQSCYEKALWRECYYAATTALSITNRELVYTADADCWGYKLYDLAAISAYYLGLKDEAVKWGLVAQELEPTNERLAKNILFYTGQIQNK